MIPAHRAETEPRIIDTEHPPADLRNGERVILRTRGRVLTAIDPYTMKPTDTPKVFVVSDRPW